ncbi:DUF6904 family protein [Hymenobacter guriensis]|uniref:Transporter substrate-binding domain-containing protein n=1 Tax=Hymenobacter guriensis TaxID=2793065 RepID=A0ABS0L4N0_9BACT|nr:hypothetical protein [Hymenobacter guriensis]MBG8555100.1 hypothetical protein [Hymenobacter guriensis]
MIAAKVTYRGTGIQLQGSPEELEMLYSTVHRLSFGVSTLQWDPLLQELMSFAYEVRKGFCGARLRIQRSPEPVIMGFRYYLPYIIVVSNVLRFAAGRVTTTRADQGQLQHLETILRQAILKHNPAADALAALVGQGLLVETRYVGVLTEKLTLVYVKSRPDKYRFGRLASDLQAYFNPASNQYKAVEQHVKAALDEQGGYISDLTYENYWPEKIIW